METTKKTRDACREFLQVGDTILPVTIRHLLADADRCAILEAENELLRAGANKLGPENRRLKAELQAEQDLANRNADEMERMRQEIRRLRSGDSSADTGGK